MFDTMTFTKIIGGFCGALLIFLLGGFLAETIYHVGGDDHGEGHAQAYVIPVEDAGGEEDEGETVPFAELYAAADPAEGEKLYRQCSSCHKLDGSNATGPYLNGVVDRQVAAVDGYSYSGALVEAADVWSPENLSGFIENPKGWAPGTKMSYRGLSDAQDRAHLIAYLASVGS